MKKRLQIFRAGTHIDISGRECSFSEYDLERTAGAYDPARHIAPLVLGHPVHDMPAYGHVDALHAQGGNLYAEVSPSPDLVQKVKEGRYISVSASFYPPGDHRNPAPGVWSLRHVGFLGAQPPAVKGMQRVAFSEATPIQWNDVTAFGEAIRPVSYAESPEGCHAAITALMAQQPGLSYAAAFAEIERRADMREQHDQADPDRQGDHMQIVAYMEAHNTTYTPDSGGVVHARELARAIAWTPYLRSHAQRLYAAATTPETTGAKLLLAKIKEGKLTDTDGTMLDAFYPRQVAVKNWSWLNKSESVRKAADLLADHGWLEKDFIPTGDKGGRPGERYLIHPGLLKGAA